jgi:hypothetical protein
VNSDGPIQARLSVSRFVILAVALVAATVTVSERSAASSVTTSSVTSTPLPLNEFQAGYADMVVDELNEQVFVSGGPGRT